MEKFKVGDAVVPANGDPYRLFEHWRDYWGKGRTVPARFYITRIEGDAIHYSDTRGGDGPQVSTDDLKPAPLFAVGDKVRSRVTGKESTVKVARYSTSLDCYLYDLSRNGRNAGTVKAEHISPATLTIAAGKYYRTRDGRKVGPANFSNIWTDGYPFEVEFGHWVSESGKDQEGREDHDLIAEWPDDVWRHDAAPAEPTAPVVAEATTAKFKVGDVVRSHKNDITTYRITEVDGDELRVDALNDDGSRCANMGFHPASLFYLATLTAPAIVCRIDNGQPMPASRPFVHASRDAATKEAKRLAGNNKGKEFGVYELVETAKEERTYEHEWQRLAVSGKKIAAIKELRSITGLISLRSAKAAVDDFVFHQEAA